MKSYNCPSCGAEMICDATTAAASCPYCGNPTIVPGQFTGGLRPELVIPFKLDKQAAVTALKKYYRGKKFLPKTFCEQNHIEEIQGVYVPFWLCDCQVDGTVTYHATNSRTWKEGDYEITETDHYQVDRSGRIGFERIPVDASTKMPDAHMDAIEPYDYNELRAFSTAYLPGFLADKYDVSQQDSMARIETRAENSAEMELRNTVSGYEAVHLQDRSFRFRKSNMKYTLMPVWMLSTKWNGRNFLFAMNGQTGRMVGELPCSKPKLAVASVLFFAIGFVLSQILFMGENAFDPDYLAFDVEGILINIVAPLIIVIIADVLLVGQLKTANEATHADCYCGELDLTEKHDTFSHTETTVVMKDNKDD